MLKPEEVKKNLTDLCELAKEAAHALRLNNKDEEANRLLFLTGMATGLAWPAAQLDERAKGISLRGVGEEI